MEINSLLSLLHVADPNLPIGGYSHSNGLETYVQKGIVKDKESAQVFLKNMLKDNLLYNDASYVKLVYEVSDNLDAIKALDLECSALKSPREIREASHKLGMRLLKIFVEENREDSFLKQFEQYVKTTPNAGNYPIVFGVLAKIMGIPLEDVLAAFYFNSATGMVTNAVKLVPLGQIEGQHILFALKKEIGKWVKETLALDREMVGVSNVGFDLRSMQHERLYSRLYMS